ncbi:MAG: hypothetical protein N2Z62_01680 [Rhodobacteraceae bacterium]|nr:hypothetical protein [Paracoccaceae bacterium]
MPLRPRLPRACVPASAATALAATLAAAPALACGKGEVVLSCAVDGGRRLEVCALADRFTYRFGPPGAPELALEVPMSAGTVTPWPGVGRAISSSVGFPVDGYLYEVWTSVERAPVAAEPWGGVVVSRGAAEVARRDCLPGTVEGPAFVLEDAMAAAGWCWDRSALLWRRDGACP